MPRDAVLDASAVLVRVQGEAWAPVRECWDNDAIRRLNGRSSWEPGLV